MLQVYRIFFPLLIGSHKDYYQNVTVRAYSFSSPYPHISPTFAHYSENENNSSNPLPIA
jgi:hypothetical protein